MNLTPDLERRRREIEGYAREYGLDFYDVVFEVLDYDQLNEVAAYGGFPTRYPHWRFGMDYEELAKSYSYGLSKIYELVINNNPVYAYLMKANAPVEQKLVMAHVFGHADFFKNNLWFSKTNRRMIDAMANHATRVRSPHRPPRRGGGRGLHRRLPEPREPDRLPLEGTGPRLPRPAARAGDGTLIIERARRVAQRNGAAVLGRLGKVPAVAAHEQGVAAVPVGKPRSANGAPAAVPARRVVKTRGRYPTRLGRRHGVGGQPRLAARAAVEDASGQGQLAFPLHRARIGRLPREQDHARRPGSTAGARSAPAPPSRRDAPSRGTGPTPVPRTTAARRISTRSTADGRSPESSAAAARGQAHRPRTTGPRSTASRSVRRGSARKSTRRSSPATNASCSAATSRRGGRRSTGSSAGARAK